MKNVTTTIPDEQMTKIKVVYLQKLWNFVVESFLIWIAYINEKYIWIFKFWKFDFFFKCPQMEKYSK
jgi:hypothetical protein